jgi:hypothetical protein
MSLQETTYAFTGPVRCERRGAQWLMEGLERTTRQPLRLVLISGDTRGLPASVPDLEVRRAIGAAPGGRMQLWRLRWSGETWELAAQSVHVQRAGNAALAAAMPGVAPSRAGRLGWALLLNLVRLPGMTRLLRALRGAG